MEDNFERDKSEFNDSLGYLGRINDMFFGCNLAAIKLDANIWFRALLRLSLELCTEMKNNEWEDVKKFREKVRPKIDIHNKHFDKAGNRTITPELFDDLFEFERFLRMVCKESGLQQKLKDVDPRIKRKKENDKSY